MSLRKNSSIIFILSLLLVFTSGIATADIVEDVKNAVPSQWFEAPATSSELGIKSFNQSPVLDEKVASGELPEVQKRLPADPPVITPIQVGEYGGTHRIFDTELDTIARDLLQLTRINLFRPDPLGRNVFPSLAKSYNFSQEGRVFTLQLREGIKWSDGENFNADDFLYWWNAEANNEDLNPIAPENWTPVGWEEVEKIDNYTIQVTFSKPNPLFVQNLRNRLNEVVGFNPSTIGTPAHFLKQYHPEYGDKEEIQDLVEEEGFDEWYQLYEHIKQATFPEYEAPSLRPYIVKERSATSTLWERNPYFPFVDTEGNQLPYIDNVRVEQLEDWAIYNAKLVTGEGTFAIGRTSPGKLPMYKNKSSEENFEVIVGQKVHSSQVRFMPNLNHKDEDIREVMQNVKFRKALSLGINREEINNTFYFGMGKPFPITVNPASPYFKDSFVKYVDYKPEQAQELLDEIGVVDQNGDGWRELPNGEELSLTISFFEYQEVVPKIVEMVVSHWQEIGLNLDMKVISGQLWNSRAQANELDMSVFAYPDSGPLAFPIRNYASSLFVPSTVFPLYSGHWNSWARWNQTGGEEGIEPPQEVKQLIEWYGIARTTMDEEERAEMCEKILAENAEKVWSIGTIARWPQPYIVNDNLKNAPESYIMGSDMEGLYPYRTETLYYEGGEAAE